MFRNAGTAIKTCNLDYVLCDMPVWKHIYHMLHSCDQYFINPHIYDEPGFHVDGLNSLEVPPGERVLSRDELLKYLCEIQTKVLAYINGLTDDMLSERPEGCRYNRLSLAMGAVRHLYAHLGNINATTIIETGKWPRVVGLYLPDSVVDDLWE
jgi:hypothetical protein